MATQRMAQGLASLGRNGDSMLMHVSPEEVSGLQRLGKPHGISLTVNPHTGLPEAFSFGKFFKQFAPTLVGAALAPATGGASLGLTGMAATAAPILGGLATGVALGQDPLMSAMAGFGGGSLGNGIAGMSSGAGGTGAAVGETTLNSAPGFAAETVASGTPDAITAGQAASNAETAGNIAKYGAMENGAAPAGGIGNLATGLQNIGQEGSWDAFKAGMGGAGGQASNTQAALAIGMPAGMSYLAGAMPPVPGENEEDKYDPNRTLNLNTDTALNLDTNTGLKLLAQGGMTSGGSTSVYGNQDGTAAQNTLKEGYGLGRLNTLAAANTTANAEMGGFAEGGNVRVNLNTPSGLTQPNPTGGYFKGVNLPEGVMEGVMDYTPANKPGFMASMLENQDRIQTMFAPLMATMKDRNESGRPLGLSLAKGGFAKGGYLDGAGDGMSDSIPATIEGKQPARLADGEFVIPADVVSHLGNGSTKAGAKHLYKMLDKVRKARTGNKKQGKQINPSKYMPA
jgi:hypothetical protein